MSTTELEKTIESAVSAVGFELIHCNLSSIGRKKLLRVFIDAPTGVSIEDCRIASRQIQSALDVEAPALADYNLEVSSPGTDRMLVKLEHFQRFIGSRVKIKLHQDMEGRRNFTGELISATTQAIQLLVDGKTFDLALANIEKANLIPDLRI